MGGKKRFTAALQYQKYVKSEPLHLITLNAARRGLIEQKKKRKKVTKVTTPNKTKLRM